MTWLGEMELVCPMCRSDLSHGPEELTCVGCGASFPVVVGIPDLRVAPDPWITPEDDRAKALRVLEASRDDGFEDSVRAYWRRTPGTPPAKAERFVDHVLRAADRSREWLATDPSFAGADGAWLDLGCGTADFAAAAPDGSSVVGVDVAMRWLVIARKRLQEAGRPCALVCANAEALPFRDGTFSRVVALGLLEHCADPRPVLAEAARVLRPGGHLRGRTVNRFSALPEPHVGLWGVGLLPRRWARRYVPWRTGASYDQHHLRSAFELERCLRRAGFTAQRVEAAPTLPSEVAGAGATVRSLTPLYEACRRTPALAGLLRIVAPLLEFEGVSP